MKPMTAVHAVITENFICNSNKTDSASIGETGSSNEKQQPDILSGGPGESGSKADPFAGQQTGKAWED